MGSNRARHGSVLRGLEALTRHAIVARALDIADSEGLDRVSFRRLATAFAVTPMALYSHVEDKADLLNAMADMVLSEISVETDQGTAWADRLRATLGAVYKAFDKHAAAGALIGRPLASASAMRLTEALLVCLDEAGFSPAESVRLIQALTGMVLGQVILQSGYGALARQTAESSDRERARFGEFVEHLSEGEYPTLLRVLPAMLDWPSPAEVRELAVDLLVDGLRTLSNERRLAHSQRPAQSQVRSPTTRRSVAAPKQRGETDERRTP